MKKVKAEAKPVVQLTHEQIAERSLESAAYCMSDWRWKHAKEAWDKAADPGPGGTVPNLANAIAWHGNKIMTEQELEFRHLAHMRKAIADRIAEAGAITFASKVFATKAVLEETIAKMTERILDEGVYLVDWDHSTGPIHNQRTKAEGAAKFEALKIYKMALSALKEV